MPIEIYFLFFITTSVVILSPGPSAILISGQGASKGAKAAFCGVAGIASANVVYFLLSATGISSLLIASPFIFQIIKWLGVAYLVYLGLSALFSNSGGLVIKKNETGKFSPRNFFVKGFIIEISNPKALLYFSALLPQFLEKSEPISGQLFLMGATITALDLSIYSLYGILGATLSKTVVKSGWINTINRVAGIFLLFSAAKMATI